jgi:hypothetical protein
MAIKTGCIAVLADGTQPSKEPSCTFANEVQDRLILNFGVLSTRREESFLGITLLIAGGCLWLVVRMLRVNPLKVVPAQLPENTDEQIAALEDGLARCNPYDVSTNSLARYRLMELYEVRKRYQDAISQGKLILALNGINHELEDEVRVEIAVCLDFLGRTDEVAMERMAVADESYDRPQGFMGWRARGSRRIIAPAAPFARRWADKLRPSRHSVR